MDNRSVDQYYHFVYDPILYGVSLDYWKEITGSPSLTSNIIRFQGDTVASKEQYAFGDFVFRLNIPVAPGAGSSRRFGLIDPAFGVAKNAMYFDIAGTAFTANVVADDGTTTTSTLTWNSNWSATATDFRIHWDRGEVRFLINDVTFARVNDVGLIPRVITLPIYIQNATADNMDMTFMQLRNVYQVVSPKWGIGVPADDTTADYRDVSVNEAASVADVPTLAVSDASPSVSDAVTVVENITARLDVGDISTIDTVTIAEDITATVSDPELSVNDAVAIVEAITTTVDGPEIPLPFDVTLVAEVVVVDIQAP